MNAFFKSLYETLIFRIFCLAYPISLYYLYKENKILNFWITLLIISLSLIYFFCYYYIKKNEKNINICASYLYKILYCLIGYLVQFNLAFLDTYEIKEGELKINIFLSILKILMIFETLKRIYYYSMGILILIDMESQKGDRSLYVMTFEIVYYYFWFNFYTNYHSSGYSLSRKYFLTGIFVSLLHGIFAIGCYFFFIKICFGVLNLCYFLAQCYSIYWRYRENY